MTETRPEPLHDAVRTNFLSQYLGDSPERTRVRRNVMVDPLEVAESYECQRVLSHAS